MLAAVAVAHAQLDARLVLRHVQRLGFIQKLDHVVGLENRAHLLRQLPLFALNAVGVGGFALQNGKVERGDHAFAPVAELPQRGEKATLDETGRDAKLVEEVERRGVKGRGAKIHWQFMMQLEDRRPDPRLAQTRGRDETDRSRANDDDPVLDVRHAIPPLSREAILAATVHQMFGHINTNVQCCSNLSTRRS